MTKSISDLLSNKRLDGYKGASNNGLDILLHRYNYNIELGNEFYPLLSIFEIAFRNSLHTAWSTSLNDTAWLLNYANHSFLGLREKTKIQNAIAELTEKNKPLEEGRIIAELTLGFWVSLFDRPFIEINKKIIRDLFPNASNKQRDIFVIKDQLADIRNLRNRVFHHEPIWYWTNLNDFVSNLKNYIEWMNKDLMLPRVQKCEVNLRQLIDRQSAMLK